MLIAITPYRILTQQDVNHYTSIASCIDTLILRTPMHQHDLKVWIQTFIKAGFPKDKITIHSDIALLQSLKLSRIHFREMDAAAFQYKKNHPEVCVSMSTHSKDSVQAANNHHLDYVLFGHLFETNSKKGQKPRTTSEIEAVLKVNVPIIALGGINQKTLHLIPKGFKGFAAISYFLENNITALCALKEDKQDV